MLGKKAFKKIVDEKKVVEEVNLAKPKVDDTVVAKDVVGKDLVKSLKEKEGIKFVIGYIYNEDGKSVGGIDMVGNADEIKSLVDNLINEFAKRYNRRF